MFDEVIWGLRCMHDWVCLEEKYATSSDEHFMREIKYETFLCMEVEI